MIDLGCGSGILPIILSENGGFEGEFTLIDSIQNAIQCSKINLQLYNILQNKVNGQCVDLVDLWFPKDASKFDISEK